MKFIILIFVFVHLIMKKLLVKLIKWKKKIKGKKKTNKKILQTRKTIMLKGKVLREMKPQHPSRKIRWSASMKWEKKQNKSLRRIQSKLKMKNILENYKNFKSLSLKVMHFWDMVIWIILIKLLLECLYLCLIDVVVVFLFSRGIAVLHLVEWLPEKIRSTKYGLAERSSEQGSDEILLFYND